MSHSQKENDAVTSIFEIRNDGMNAIEYLPEKHFPKARCGFERLKLFISLYSSHPASERVKKNTLFLQRLPKPFGRFLLNQPVFLVFESNVKLTTTKAKTILKILLEAESDQKDSVMCAPTAAQNSDADAADDAAEADEEDVDDAADAADADAVDDADTKEECEDDNDDNDTFAACDAVDDASDAGGCDEENEDDDDYCATDNFSLPADC